MTRFWRFAVVAGKKAPRIWWGATDRTLYRIIFNLYWIGAVCGTPEK